MGKISQALIPTRPAGIARRNQPDNIGPVGSALVKAADAAGLTPHQLSKAVAREAARSSNVSELAARLGVDPTMGAPFAAWDDNRMFAAMMGPGSPARPFPLGGEPRQWQYRVGYNFPSPPDTDRGIDAPLLRILADSFDLLRLCIEIRKHDITHLDWDIVPVEKNRSKREEWLKQNQPELDRIKQFFEWPEAYTAQDAGGHWVRRGKVKWEDWLGALLEDYFVGDWLTVWPRVLRNGDLLAFDRVDGATIKPLLDLDGRIPEPPTPAYQQYLFGVPRASFDLEELIYRPRLVRNHSPFGFSHVEQMLVLINMALRFQMWNTQGYTDGSLPLGLLEFPEGFSPDQIQAVIEELNAAMSGLASARQQFHGVPFGTKWNPLKPFQFDETFAQYVVEYTAAMFGLNAQKLGFMPGRGGQGLGGKGFAEQQSNDAEEKSTVPDARWVEGLMNELVERYFGRADVRFVFTDLEDSDEKGQIEADQAAIIAGLKSWDQALEERGEEPVGISEPFIVIGNVPWSVGDIKAVQEGEPRNPQAPALPVDEEPEPEGPEGGGVGGVPPAPSGSGGPVEHAGPQPAAPQPPEPAAAQQNGKPAPRTDTQQDTAGGRKPEKPQAEPNQKPAEEDTDETGKTFDTSSGMQPHGLVRPDINELRRWKRHAAKAAKEGRQPRPFATDLIPDTVKTMIADQLEPGLTPDEVRAIFDEQIAAAKFDAGEHPRARNGEFAPAGGGSALPVRTLGVGRNLATTGGGEHLMPGYGGTLIQGAHPVSATITLAAPVQAGPTVNHVAAWVGVADKNADHWLQAGIAEQKGKTSLYVEGVGADGKYHLVTLADAKQGVPYRFAIVHDGKAWRAMLNGHDVGMAVDVPGAATTAITSEVVPAGPTGTSFRFDFSGVKVEGATGPLSVQGSWGAQAELTGADSFTSWAGAATKSGSGSLVKAAHPMGVEGLEWANYRHADTPGGRDCATCSYWRQGNCSMFAIQVEPDSVCDLWTNQEPTDKAAKTSQKVTVAGLCVRAGDTGRVLMLQRSIGDDKDPAAGKWEFPGGHLEPGETPVQGAIREWQEETGATLPSGEVKGSWRSGSIYQGFVYVIGRESDLPLNIDADDRHVLNPDDPDGDDIEVVAWWPPSDAKGMPGLRDEVASGTNWKVIDAAVPDAKFKAMFAELVKIAPARQDDTARERHIKELTAAGAAVLAAHAVASYGQQVALDRQVDDTVAKLAQHYRQAAQAGSRAAAQAHAIDELAPEQLDRIAGARAEAQRANVRAILDQAAANGNPNPQTIHLVARGAKPAYEQGYGTTVTTAAPEAEAVWHVTASDPCDPCADRDGQVFTADELPGWPGDGEFGGDLCEGGPNDRCELEWRIPPAGDSAEFAARADLEKTAPAPPPSVGEQLLERGISALERLADKPAAQVTVEPAQVTVEAPPPAQVTVNPEITVEAAKPPDVQVTVEAPKRGAARIEKTKDGGLRLTPEED